MKFRTFVLVNYDVLGEKAYIEKPYLFESDNCCIDGAKYANVRNRKGDVKLAKVLDIVSTSSEDYVNMLLHATGATEPLCKVVSIFRELVVEKGETKDE